MHDAVTLAYVHDNDYTQSFADSREDLIAYDITHHQRLMRGGYLKMRCGTDGLAEARNMAVAAFLDTDSDWLFWVDTDMGFAPDSLERLIAAADPTERPIVGGLCFANKEVAIDGYHGYRTAARVTILDWVKPSADQPATFTGRSWYPTDTIVQCKGTGAAFVLIHRNVFEKVCAEYGPTWYDRIRGDDGKPIGEDISFCIRVGELGFPVHVHTGVKTTHLKNIWLGEQDFWDQQISPPAAEPVAVLAPSDDTELATSLRASTGWATNGDDGSAPWVFAAESGSRFYPGWYDHTIRAAAMTGAKVIGVNGSLGVLIARDYLDELGASLDGPGTILHGGYRAQGGLVEIAALAEQRDVWALSLAAKVIAPPAEPDEHDMRLFEKRLKRAA